VTRGGAVPDEAGDFAEFVTGRGRALPRTAWLLTGYWALAEDPGADRLAVRAQVLSHR
jgi:hypothetical protein